jgi:Mn-dependent DtxR family transcriptional regulator
MLLSKTERLILYSLGQFYKSINQPLTNKHLKLRTSKIAFIEVLLSSKIITKQARTLYKNLENLEKKKLISYDKRMIKLTPQGLNILEKINVEIKQFVDVKDHLKDAKKPRRKLQTVIN